MLHLWMGRAKTGKTAAVLEAIRDLGDRSRQILLVPEHVSHKAEVDLCRVCGDTASRHAEVLSFRRLGDRVLSRTGGIAQVSLDAGGRLLTVQRCAEELSASLTVYRRPSRKPAFLVQLLELFDELRSYAVTPEVLSLRAQETSGPVRDKLSDLALLYGAYESRLRQNGHDARDPMSRLCDHLAESGYVRDKDLFLDGFTYFNAQERRILEIMLRQASSVTVTLLGEPGEAGEEAFFAPALKTRFQLERLAQDAGCEWDLRQFRAGSGGALGHLERYFFGGGVPWPEEQVPIRVLEAGTPLTEVEQAAAEIRRLVSSGRVRYRDIAVAARNMEDYEAPIAAVFPRWEIPVYLSRRSDILEKPVVSLLTGVLAAVTDGYEYEEMFRWLKTGLGGLTPEECDVLENYVLKWEIHGSMWLRDVDWTEHPEGYGVPWTAARQEQLDQVNALRRRVRPPLSALSEDLKAAKTAREKVEALYGFMEHLGLQAALEERMRRQAEAGRLQEAEETAQLWEILCGILDQFVEILGEEPMDTDTFARLFRQALSQYSVGTIPAALDQVSAGEITRNDRHTVKYLFFLGANDHVLPSPGQSGGILNREDRQELAKLGVELAPTGMEQLGIELHHLYAALSQPTEGLWVSCPLRDTSGGELRPAFLIDRLKTLFPSLNVEKEDPGKSWRLTAPLPALEAAGYDTTLRRYFRAQSADGGPDGSNVQSALDAMERAAALRRGSLSPQAVRALYGTKAALSASRLERMRSCHFSYFMEYGLKAKPRKEASFDAPQIGTFLHYLLEHVTRDVLAMGGFGAVEEAELHRLTNQYIRQFEQETFGDLSRKGARFRYLFTRLRRTARTVVDLAAEELRQSDFVPVAFELSFGDGGDVPAVVIREPDSELRLQGRADRVDGWIKDGKLYVRVVDYKSGKKRFDLGAVRMGLDLQMLLYLFALGDQGAARFGREIVPAGVLYFPVRDDILPADRAITPEQLVRLREKELRRTGLLLSDPEVLRAMEHEALTEPRYLPLRVGKDGSIAGGLASAEQFGKLRRYVDRLLTEIAAEIRGGNINADPCVRHAGEDPCQYCDWGDACHFQEGRDTDCRRYVLPMDPTAFWEWLEREEAP